jgi:hypothetical protein
MSTVSGSNDLPLPLGMMVTVTSAASTARLLSMLSAAQASAAAPLGGKLLSTEVLTGDIGVHLVWLRALGYVFAASPRLVLIAGHWCPECVRDSASYRAQGERNPLLALIDGPAGP